jgi:predicted CopG family antitoxin
MTSTMTPSERRRAYKLKRIVISEHNYLALKRLGQAGDSFNDVINDLLRVEKNHRQEQEKEILQHQQRHIHQEQQQKSKYDIDRSMGHIINNLDSSSFIDEAMVKHGQQMDELFRAIEENQERKQQEH